MGAHDYTCSVCRAPASYICGEATGTECQEDGIGNDEVFVDLFHFPDEQAPEDADAFEAKLSTADKVDQQKRGFDWGEWEFVPSLNYRTLLMDDEDATGVWQPRPFREHDDGSPIELPIAEGHTVWAVNYCPSCRARFVDGAASDAPCRLYLEHIREHLGIPLGDDKIAFVAQVTDRVKRRRPASA